VRYIVCTSLKLLAREKIRGRLGIDEPILKKVKALCNLDSTPISTLKQLIKVLRVDIKPFYSYIRNPFHYLILNLVHLHKMKLSHVGIPPSSTHIRMVSMKLNMLWSLNLLLSHR